MTDDPVEAKASEAPAKADVVVKVRRRIKKKPRRIDPAVPTPDPRALSAVDVVIPPGEPLTSDEALALGRMTTYRPEYTAQVVKLVQLGATNQELADFFGVCITTITRWASTFEEFAAALRLGRDAFTVRVERSLAARALGYSFDSVKIFCTKEGDVIEVPFREHVPPDVTACIFWLKNRDPDNWRDVNHHKHSGNVTLSITPEETKW